MRLLRFVRFLALAVLSVVVITGLLAIGALLNRDRLIRSALATVRARTGFEIVPAGATLAFRSHLVIILDHPRLMDGNREVARADHAEAQVSYSALIHENGLPLARLILLRPQVVVAAPIVTARTLVLPRPDASTAKAITDALPALSSVTRRLEITDGSLVDERGSAFVSHLDLTGYSRKHLRPSPWWTSFIFTWNGDSATGTKLSGDLRFGHLRGEIPSAIVQGKLRVEGISLDKVNLGRIVAGGALQTEVEIALRDDGRVDGAILTELKDLTLGNKPPVALGDYSLRAGFDATANLIELSDLAIRQGTSLLLSGQCRLGQPYEANPQVGLSCAGLEANLPPLKRFLKSGALGLPPWLTAPIDQITSGRIWLDRLALDSSVASMRAMDTSLLRQFSLDGRVEGLGVALAPEAKLPPLRDVTAVVHYKHGILTLRQGRMRAGNSEISAFDLRADFAGDPAKASYTLRFNGDADLNKDYDWLAGTSARLGIDPARWIARAGGVAFFTAEVTGALDGLNLRPPERYAGTIEPRAVSLTLKNPPVAIGVDSGAVAFTPHLLTFDHLLLALKPGTATMDGTIEFVAGGVAVRHLAVALQQVPADKWLPKLLDPHDLSARGDLGGKLVLDFEPGVPLKYSVNGAVTIGPGEIQFGFIRSPILVHAATLTLNGHDALLDMPKSTLEGQALDMKVGFDDLQHPALRIDAVVQRMDLEVLRFIRLPWSPKTPTYFIGGAATGHVEVRKGNFAGLPFSDLKTDFERKGGDWRVYNLEATSLSGRVNLAIIGREADDWIEMKGRVAGMDTGALFIVGGQQSPALTGKLYCDFDLWADTDTDFFDTLAGRGSLVVRDGRLERFTLLSRLLGLIDLKNWLSAQVPDPRATGLPFKFVNASFAGHHGWFYSDDFLLDGPVMDIIGEGSVNLTDSSLAMELAVIPFQTVSWLLSKIPVIGKNLSQNSGSILAAYFWVHGSVHDPKVTPMPITSAAEIVKKVLALPINLIRPNTVK